MEPALGLSTYRWNNNLKSILLLLMFPLLLLLLLGGLFYLFSWSNVGPDGTISPYTFARFGLTPVLGTRGPLDLTDAAILAYWPFVLGAATIWMLLGYLFNEMMIRAATGATPVTRAQAPRLYKILENLCIARGLATPKLYIIDTDALNAYATGIDQRTYSITVTRALLDQLDDAELEAVLGHELTHIMDRDVRLLLVTIVFAGAISFIAQLLWRGLRIGSMRRGRNAGLVILIAAVIAGIGYVLALLLRFAISRRREYLADAGSVALTKNPEALISALRKIARQADVPHVPSEVRQMFIENPRSSSAFFDLFSTHPPIEDRIRILERLEGGSPGVASPLHHETGSVPDAGPMPR